MDRTATSEAGRDVTPPAPGTLYRDHGGAGESTARVVRVQGDVAHMEMRRDGAKMWQPFTIALRDLERCGWRKEGKGT